MKAYYKTKHVSDTNIQEFFLSLSVSHVLELLAL